MPRATHKPPYNYANDPELNLDNLLAEFRRNNPDMFSERRGLVRDEKIPTYLNGWELATHPLAWRWLAEFNNLGVERVALSVAHSLIGNCDYPGATSFLEWIKKQHPLNPPCPLAVMHLRKWLAGEQDKQTSAIKQARENLSNDFDRATERLFAAAKSAYTAWASGADKRMPRGMIATLLERTGLDLDPDAARKRLTRMRDRHLNSDA